ncbi:hypothetical protein TP70_00575 [Staphylococcus microti]|uniref:Tubby C-terminal domain-containing protein n=1 Tax=Staphylococcus microti TaxID=569857 RepID=A0A0D6XT66_9STAP|nr:hypothetical protein [Staphylococcus microti]KIX91807.1 hypothetical protein TP70_00575 [Staphylococcus microti]PNZ84425.1 hypothetical protein CD132_00325 [Staphylococcus microti]SUM58378.1 Uncharacterised protein [Staphylococcus microti]
MTTYHYKENLLDSSTKEMPIYDEHEQHVMMMRVLHNKKHRGFSGWLGALKQEYEITDGNDIYYVRRQKSFRSHFYPVWDVYHNHQLIGQFTVSVSIFKPKIQYADVQGNELTWQTGLLSHSVTATDSRGDEIVKSKSSYFKIRTTHDVTLQTKDYSPLLLLLLFQVTFEYFEMIKNASSSASTSN